MTELTNNDEVYQALVKENFKKVDFRNNSSNKYPRLFFKCEGCSKGYYEAEHPFIYSELGGSVIAESSTKFLYCCIKNHYSILRLKGLLKKSLEVEYWFKDFFRKPMHKNTTDLLSEFWKKE